MQSNVPYEYDGNRTSTGNLRSPQRPAQELTGSFAMQEETNVADLCRRVADQAANVAVHSHREIMQIREGMSRTGCDLSAMAKPKQHSLLISKFDGITRDRDNACCCARPDGLAIANPSAVVFRSSDHCAAGLCHDLLMLQGQLAAKGGSGSDMAELIVPHLQKAMELRKRQYTSLKALATMATSVKHAMAGEQEKRTEAMLLSNQHLMTGMNRAERGSDKFLGTQGKHTPGSREEGGTDLVTKLAFKENAFVMRVGELYNDILSIREEETRFAYNIGLRITDTARNYWACPKAQDALRSAFDGVVPLDDRRSNLDQAVFRGGQSDLNHFHDVVETLLKDLRAQDTMTSTLSVRSKDKEWVQVVKRFEQLRSDSMSSARGIFNMYHALGGKVEALGRDYDVFQAGGKHGDSEGRTALQRNALVGVELMNSGVLSMAQTAADSRNILSAPVGTSSREPAASSGPPGQQPVHQQPVHPGQQQPAWNGAPHQHQHQHQPPPNDPNHYDNLTHNHQVPSAPPKGNDPV